MLIETTTGNQNLPGALAKCHVFAVSCRAFHMDERDVPGGEAHLHQAASKHLLGIRYQNKGGSIPAVTGMGDRFGLFNNSTYYIPDGVVLKLFASRKPTGSTALNPMTCSQFVRIREGGAWFDLQVALNPHPDATVTWGHLSGRMDMLSLEEAEDLGVKVNPMTRRLFVPTSVRQLVRKVEIAPATKAATAVETKTIETTEGQVVKVKAPVTKRIIDV